MGYYDGVKLLPNFRAAQCACFLCFLSLATPVFAASPTLAQIIARHQAASGTPGAARDKAAHQIVYDISAGGLTGTMTSYEAPPHRLRTELVLGPLSITTGSNGKINWEQDGSGTVRILGGEELTEHAADTSFSLESYDPFKKGMAGTVTLAAKRDPETGCYVLEARPKGGTRQTIFIDPKTYLVRKFIERKGGIAGTIEIQSYRTFFGEKIPAHLQIQYGGLPLAIEADLQKAVRLPTMAEALFSPPILPKDWEFLLPSAGKEVSVPFSLEAGEIVLAASVDGHPLRLLLDSGAGGSFITSLAAQNAGITTQGNLQALGYGGASATGVATAATIDVGTAIRLHHQPLVVIKDPNVAKLLSERGHVDGALGYELFTRFAVQIDYAKKTVVFRDPIESIGKPILGEITLPLKLENRMPTVMASVDNHPPARFLLDTGDAGAVHLYSQYALANSFLPKAGDPAAQTHLGVGVGGVLSETATPGHTLRLGTAQIPNLSLATMTGPGITRISTLAGGIGSQALQGFVVTFDYPHGVIRLEKAGPETAVPEKTEKTDKTEKIDGRAGVDGRAGASPAPTGGLTLETLLEKHLAALGGREAVAAIQNTKMTSDVLTGGIHGTITTVYAAPDLEYEEDNLGILHILQGYDGKYAWQRDSNGNVRPLAGEELKNLRVQLFFDTNSYVIPGRIPGKMTLQPALEAGTGDYIVDALPAGGKETTLFFDPKTWLIAKEQHFDDNVAVETSFSDYHAVDGVQFPFHQVTTNGTARYDITGDVTKVANNVTLLPSLFAPPVGGKQFGFLKPGATRATVPFDMEDGEIGFTVKINGQPSRVFLDSGASGIALSQQVATKLGLKTAGFLEARGYGGSTDLRPILINRFEVPGAVQLTDITAIAIDLPPTLNSYFTHPLAGFVGYDLLAHFVVRVDFLHQQLTFIAPDAFHPTASDGPSLPIELDNDVPSVTAKLDNLPPARFLLDTGDEAALRLYSPFVSANGLDKRYPRGEVSVGGGIGGVSRSRVTRIGAFKVAGVTFESLPTDFSLDPKGGASLINAGSLGVKLLSRFVVTFDYPRSRVFFAPTPAVHAAFVSKTTGLTLIETKDASGHPHVVVAEIAANAPANTSGLNLFDEVLEIDGQQTSALGLIASRRLLGPESTRQTHTLLVHSTIGKAHTVSVSAYDPLK